jgi:phosphoribosylformimino-5-aminoimidazole carboxamide ribotide isomerase
VIRAIRKAAPNLVLEVGGGLRDQATVETLLDSGVDHAVLGTKALEDEGFLRELLRNFGRKIIVGADTREGRIATRGWTSQTEVVAIPFLKRLHDEAGLSTVIFTDIARDGMLSGPNLPALVELADAIPGLGVIASGGVGTAEHLRDLAKLRKANIVGVIVGKALYDGRVTIQDGLEALGN